MRRRASLLALDGEGRCLTVLREGEGVHGGAWLELPEAPILETAEDALSHLAELHLGVLPGRATFELRGTFHGRGDVFDATVEIYALSAPAGAVRLGELVAPNDLRERARRGEALLSPSLAAYLALGAEVGFEREGWEVTEGVFMLPLRTPTLLPATHTNAFLVAGDSAIIVEPGSPDPSELDRFVAMVDRERARLGFTLREILVTHHHPDHVGGARYLAERLELPLRAHRATADRLAGSLDFDGTIEDEERFELGRGLVIEAVHTPGHAPGHLCFLERRSGALIAGDMVAGVGTILVEKIDGDMALYLESLERMKALAPNMLLPAHGGVILSPAELLERYRAHRLMREAKVLASLTAAGSATVDELLPSAYDDAPRAIWPLAALSLEAHLIKLEREGRARHDDEVWFAPVTAG